MICVLPVTPGGKDFYVVSLALLCGGIPVISEFDTTPQIEIKMEITKMAINFGAEYMNIPPQTGQQNGGNRSRVTVEMSPGVRLQVQAVE